MDRKTNKDKQKNDKNRDRQSKGNTRGEGDNKRILKRKAVMKGVIV